MKVVAATTNLNKLNKLRDMLSPLEWQIQSAAEYGQKDLQIAEEENLLESLRGEASALADRIGRTVLADASFFEYSKDGKTEYFALQFGEPSSDWEKNWKLIRKLHGTPTEERRARFVTLMVLARPGGVAEVYQGRTLGVILHKLKGEGGKGYDPLFYALEAGKTLAEMSPSEREQLSPWERAVRGLLSHHALLYLRQHQDSLPTEGGLDKPIRSIMASVPQNPQAPLTPKRLLIATSNPGKFKELKEGLAPLGWALLSLLDFPFKMPPEEGSTFEDNAILKAAYAAKHSGIATLADDSGLEVEALGGEPGIYSARFGGKKTDVERNVYLLERLKSVPAGQRQAKFVAALVIAHPDGLMEMYRGETHGEILEAPRGEAGFGYDPLFYLPEAGKTFAEMSPEEKGPYSHRGKALRALLETHKSGSNQTEQPLHE
ncbi:MAG: non-canonical purine NTP pyrophosphatase, RdgB/HAM1 family [Meiothermus sp.]